jgi:hypothetical protein
VRDAAADVERVEAVDGRPHARYVLVDRHCQEVDHLRLQADHRRGLDAHLCACTADAMLGKSLDATGGMKGSRSS